jgi:hypothetical protein
VLSSLEATAAENALLLSERPPGEAKQLIITGFETALLAFHSDRTLADERS